MAPHLTEEELDELLSKREEGWTIQELHTWLTKARDKRGLETPRLKRFRNAIRGTTYKRARVETRGRPCTCTPEAVRKMNRVRKNLLKAAKGEKEVRWRDIRSASRTKKAADKTIREAFKREGILVAARRPREKPDRTPEQANARVKYCKVWHRKPPSFWLKKVDLMIDNKRFEIPTTEWARRHFKKQRVRFHLRTPGEGSLPHMTKPGRKKNKMNTRALAHVCAGIRGNRIVLWEYLPKLWCGEEAAKLYRSAISKTLAKCAGQKRKYLVFEDNDPVGYKSGKGIAAKADVGIDAVPMPEYSPDLNPLDFSLWDAVEDHMFANHPPIVEMVAAYKKRLRLTTLRLPAAVVEKAMRKIPGRMKDVIAAKGYIIKKD